MNYLLNFLQDLLPYGEEDSDAANKDHRNPASDRQAKINRYKQTKELKSNILVNVLVFFLNTNLFCFACLQESFKNGLAQAFRGHHHKRTVQICKLQRGTLPENLQ